MTLHTLSCVHFGLNVQGDVFKKKYHLAFILKYLTGQLVGSMLPNGYSRKDVLPRELSVVPLERIYVEPIHGSAVNRPAVGQASSWTGRKLPGSWNRMTTFSGYRINGGDLWMLVNIYRGDAHGVPNLPHM